ncbi:MAG: hypothetical protein RMX96_22115 [Nostoc sp. ChiSLP02]|nr:hypothetical protein [Nostoc sp. DedSLP05]MDZ8099098.1 hypothetical protein [Nostoc sp. DedSLP01]MDZ8187532.1 hypothetical protein [Nostoc sp. ChiSLP02]
MRGSGIKSDINRFEGIKPTSVSDSALWTGVYNAIRLLQTFFESVLPFGIEQAIANTKQEVEFHHYTSCKKSFALQGAKGCI